MWRCVGTSKEVDSQPNPRVGNARSGWDSKRQALLADTCAPFVDKWAGWPPLLCHDAIAFPALGSDKYLPVVLV